MGALHQGHAALIRAARKQGGRVLVSVFVNPLQFAPNEDFARYPRRLQDDHALALEAGADALWAPQIEDLFPAGAAGLTQLAPAPELVVPITFPGPPEDSSRRFQIATSGTFGQATCAAFRQTWRYRHR